MKKEHAETEVRLSRSLPSVTSSESFEKALEQLDRASKSDKVKRMRDYLDEQYDSVSSSESPEARGRL